MTREALAKTVEAATGATVLMTALIYLLRSVGVPVLDVAAVLGAVPGGFVPPVFSPVWWVGFFDHLLLGIVFFPFVYVYLLGSMLTDSRVFNGVIWGIALWAFYEMAIVPFSDTALVATQADTAPLITGVFLSITSLAVHVAYGLTFALLAPARFVVPHRGVAAAH